MAPTGRGVPGVWKQSGAIWAIKDMMRYAAAVKFLNQCQGPDAVPRSVHRHPRECVGTVDGAQREPSKLSHCVGLSWSVRGFENTSCL